MKLHKFTTCDKLNEKKAERNASERKYARSEPRERIAFILVNVQDRTQVILPSENKYWSGGPQTI